MSAPTFSALRLLEGCQDRVSQLTSRIDSLSRLNVEEQVSGQQLLRLPLVVRAQSMPDLERLENIQVTMSEDQLSETIPAVPKSKTPRRCHQCHAPLEEQVHAGIKAGVGVCSLPHWESCLGDIPEAQYNPS